MTTYRPPVMGTRHMVSAGHYLAAEAGFTILEAGGNAVDAGVAAGIALGVLQSDIVQVSGVAPIILRMADTEEVLTIGGLGGWPGKASLDMFVEEHGGSLPEGILRTVVPAAPCAWITALGRFGTMSFGEVAAAAIRFARDGFPMHGLMAGWITDHFEDYQRWPSNAAIYLPGGKVPEVGSRFVQADLGRTLQFMADEETAASLKGRDAGLEAARAAFYTGDIAKTFVDFHAENGGLLTAGDMAEFRCRMEPPVRVRFADYDVYTCGPWCQGPVLAQMLALLDGVDLAAMGLNTPAYVHTVAETMNLAFADREEFYGDPHFVDVPLDMLLSPEYAAARRALIRADRAFGAMPVDGPVSAAIPAPAGDTSYVCVVDREGNVFSATPSDVSYESPIVPGTGMCPSSRGSQSWAVPGHASCVEPGKRPRLTPNPAMAVREGKTLIPFGTPGGDVQCQAMLQSFVNFAVFGMDVQAAIESPRFGTFSFPNSFEPHPYHPGRLMLEGRFDAATRDALVALGHDVDMWDDLTPRAGGMCMIAADLETGVLSGGADPRRQSYAVGW